MNAQARAIDYRDIYAGRVRAIESLYDGVHDNLLEWGRWGRQRFPGKPRLMLSGIWLLPGDTDPNRDPEAVPTVPIPSFDERMILALDARIHSEDFASLWRKVLHANYVRRLPEYQRHEEASKLSRRGGGGKISPETFIEQLSNALDYLRGME